MRPPLRRARGARFSARSAWFALLLAAICFEGLGRKFLPSVSGQVFYFAKDGVLLAGLATIGISRPAARTGLRLFGGLLPVVPLAVAWTVMQIGNPDQRSFELGLLGLRAYWLWLGAPFVVASALERERDSDNAMTALGIIAAIVSVFALIQFSLPPDHPWNRYAATGPEMDIAIVGTTGRARVTSTFSYISGFTDFITIAPALLLSLGLGSRTTRRRAWLLGATVLTAVALPTAGSRAPVLLSLGSLAVVALSAGLFWTHHGRRVVIAGALAVSSMALLSGEAWRGVEDRFNDDPAETRTRVLDVILSIPPLAMTAVDYPSLGTGTGTMQNAATVLSPVRRYGAEIEQQRVLIEQGVPGYLLLALVRVGLLVAMLRAGVLLRRADEKAGAGAAWVLAALTIPGNLYFDHVFEALYFVAAGVVLSIVVRACQKQRKDRVMVEDARAAIAAGHR